MTQTHTHGRGNAQAITRDRQGEFDDEELPKGRGEACNAAQHSAPSHPNAGSQDTGVQRLELVASGVAIAALSSAPTHALRLYSRPPKRITMQIIQHLLCAWPASCLTVCAAHDDVACLLDCS